jgi:transcriptional regulator with XRE-family HTH domain
MADNDQEPKDRLRQARDAMKLTRAQLADKVGVAESTVRAHETGQNNIKPAVAILYAGALNVEAPWLLYGTTNSPELTRARAPGDHPPTVWDRNRLIPIVSRTRNGYFPAKESDDETEARVTAWLTDPAQAPDHFLFLPVPGYDNVSEFYAYEEIRDPPDPRHKHYVVVAPLDEEFGIEGDEVVIRSDRDGLQETDVYKLSYSHDEEFVTFYVGDYIPIAEKIIKMRPGHLEGVVGVVVCRLSIRRRPVFRRLPTGIFEVQTPHDT